METRLGVPLRAEFGPHSGSRLSPAAGVRHSRACVGTAVHHSQACRGTLASGGPAGELQAAGFFVSGPGTGLGPSVGALAWTGPGAFEQPGSAANPSLHRRRRGQGDAFFPWDRALWLPTCRAPKLASFRGDLEQQPKRCPSFRPACLACPACCP